MKKYITSWQGVRSYILHSVNIIHSDQRCFVLTMRGSRKFVRGGPTSITFFSLFFQFAFFQFEQGDPNTTISGASSVRQQNAIEMAFRWRANGGQTLNAAW